jgi:DNA ligase D-like protein (predicted polymerase)
VTSSGVEVEVEGERIRITSPDKVLFPARGWTKLDVVHHFLGCLDGSFRAVRDRPTMLKRYMESVEVDPVYQKRAPKGAPFDVVDVSFPSQRPGRMVVPRRPSDVIRLVQLGCLDLHPWPVRASDTDHPDELRLDFDPTPGFGFDRVREAVGAARELLDELGLVGWPKTSGGRGIHVYVRIEPRWGFVEARRAVLAFARELERRRPDLVTTSWWKEERKGVFVDYNQMARDKTVSAAYGVRPSGLVSAPFRWEELDSVRPEDFPMDRYVPDRYLKVGDLMAGMDDAPGRIDRLLEMADVDEKVRGLPDAPWPPHYPKQPNEPPRVQPSKRRQPTTREKPGPEGRAS